MFVTLPKRLCFWQDAFVCLQNTPKKSWMDSMKNVCDMSTMEKRTDVSIIGGDPNHTPDLGNFRGFFLSLHNKQYYRC